MFDTEWLVQQSACYLIQTNIDTNEQYYINICPMMKTIAGDMAAAMYFESSDCVPLVKLRFLREPLEFSQSEPAQAERSEDVDAHHRIDDSLVRIDAHIAISRDRVQR